MPLTTVLASKDQSPLGYLPILLYTFTFADGGILRLSSHALSVAEGGSDFGVQYGGHDYIAKIDVEQAEIARIQAVSASAITLIPSVAIPIKDPDSSIYLTWEMAAGKGFKGATVVLDAVLYDPIARTFSTDAKRTFYGICEQPRRNRTGLTLQASSLKNPQIQSLPSPHIQPRCFKFFPSSLTERQKGADDRSSLWWDCGFSPDVTGPNAVGNLIGGVAPTTCNKTRAQCQQYGMFDKDSANRITRRFGGFEWNGPTSFKGKSYLDGKTVIGYNTSNEARFNDVIPLVYGTAWVDVAMLQPLGEPNSTRIEGVVCYGPVQKIIKVIANDVEIPFENPHDNLFTWRFVNRTGTPGDRTGGFNTDAIYSINGVPQGDPYGSVTVIELVLPNTFIQSTGVPHVRAWIDSQQIPVPNAPTDDPATWPRKFTRNPAWILMDLLVWCNYTYAEFDLTSWFAAATFCNQPITYTDQNGASVTHERYKSGLPLHQPRNAADIIQGVLNSFNAVLVPNNAGNQLQLFIRQTLADQQPSPVDGSNYNVGTTSAHADGTAGTGYYAYAFDESNIIAETLVTLPLTSAESGNRISISFQDEDNAYVQDGVTTSDPFAVARSGNQDLPSSYSVDSIQNFDQANRTINTRMAELFRGNPRGDAGGTIRYQFEASTGALGLRIGQIVRLSWQQDGVSNQAFRVHEIEYLPNAERIRLVVSWHSDGWYEDIYGQSGDPFYSDPRKDIPVRAPYPWKAFGEIASGDAIYPSGFSSFGLTTSYVTQADGTALTNLQVSGRPPANDFGTADPPNVPNDGSNFITTANVGGSIPSGNYLIGFSSIDANGKWSSLSKLVGITVPGGTNTNTITVRNIYWPASAVAGALFIGTDELSMYADQRLTGTPSLVTLTALPMPDIGPPDVKFDHFHVRIKPVVHSGVVGAAINAIGTNSCTIAGFGASTVNQFANHVLTLLGTATPGNSVPIFNTRITGSVTVGVDLQLSLQTSLPSSVQLGDAITIRALPSHITTNTIGDDNFINSLYPTGLSTAGQGEANLYIWIIDGPGADQQKKILSNTATVYTIEGTWDTLPTADSIFIVVGSAWQYDKITDAWHVSDALPAYSHVISDNYIDNPDGETVIVQVLTEDALDQSGPDSYAPKREVFVFGSAGTTGSTAIDAPGNVTNLSYTVIDAAPDANGTPQKEVTVGYVPPSPIGSFTGVWIFLDAPDTSGSQGAQDGTAVPDGTQPAGGTFQPQQVSFAPYVAESPQVRFTWPAPQVEQMWRVYLPSGGENTVVTPVEYGLIGSSPSIAFEVDPPGTMVISGREWAPLVLNATLDADSPLREIKASGDQYFRYQISWDWPTDPSVSRLGGVDIVIDELTVTGPILTRTGRRLPRGGDQQDRQLEASPGYPGPSMFSSDLLPIRPGTTFVKIWLVSFDVDSNINTIIQDVTPSVTFNVQPVTGTDGQEYAPVVFNFQASVTHDVSIDGVETFGFNGIWDNPDTDLNPQFAGVNIVSYNRDTGEYNTIATEFFPSTTFSVDIGPTGQTQPIFDLFAVSFDTNNNANTLIRGVTPEEPGLHPIAQTSGSLKANRADPSTLQPTLGVSGGRLGVPNGSLQIAHFASGIQPPVLASFDPALPSATYPPGAYYFNTVSRALRRVNAAGTAWESGVNSPDLAVNSVIAGTVAAGAIGSREMNSIEIRVGGGTTAKPAQFGVYTSVSGVETLIGWIGTNGGNVGAWFKTCRIGGTSYATGIVQADANGNVLIAGATFTLTKNGMTMTIDSDSSGVGTNPNGVSVRNDSTGVYGVLQPGFLRFKDTSGVWQSPVFLDPADGKIQVSTNKLFIAQALVTTATGGSSSVPGTCAGFILVSAGFGLTYKIPLYNS